MGRDMSGQLEFNIEEVIKETSLRNIRKVASSRNGYQSRGFACYSLQLFLIMKYWPQMTTLLVFRCLRLILLRIRLINFHIYNPVLRLSAEGALMRDDILPVPSFRELKIFPLCCGRLLGRFLSQDPRLVTSWLLTRLATFGPYTPGSRLFDPKLPARCCYP